MPFEPKWERHVGKVSATLVLGCPEMNSDEVSEILGIQPTFSNTCHENVTFSPGGVIGGKECLTWGYGTSSHISSTDINEHLRHLLTIFLPLKGRIEELRPQPFILVHIYWESTIASGPHIDARYIAGLAELGANLEIHVLKIDKVDEHLNRCPNYAPGEPKRNRSCYGTNRKCGNSRLQNAIGRDSELISID